MSNAYYGLGSLRFWNEREILLREEFTRRIALLVTSRLKAINAGWSSVRCEGPILTPRQFVSEAYDESDVFYCKAQLGEDEAVLRPETTASSYLVATDLMRSGQAKAPLIVWQLGKSFRRETNDGASPSKLRFNEFYQLEFQCIYRADSKADYREAVLVPLAEEMAHCCGGIDYRIIPSDRLPSYSERTDDIELTWKKSFKEVCSVSTRTDFTVRNSPVEYRVLEVAVGMDRLICMAQQSI
ncbi:MAG: aminoacyl--tRNA ligase-related protein [Pseudomonadota bacterium]